MEPIMFRCPVTGLIVQCLAEEIQSEDEESIASYKSIRCPACTKLHFVNFSTGKLLGDSGSATLG
jgi:hypothetical protein